MTAAEFAESTRDHIASDVTHNMHWLCHHLRELQRLLDGETLSEAAWEELSRYAADLDRLAHKSRPRLPMAREAAE